MSIYLRIKCAVRRKAGQLIPLEVSILEAAVLLAARGVNEFHGYALAKVLKEAGSQRSLTAHGTLYRALHRLESTGLIDGFWEANPDADREGRPRRRLYRLTAQAEPALVAARPRRRGVRNTLRAGWET